MSRVYKINGYDCISCMLCKHPIIMGHTGKEKYRRIAHPYCAVLMRMLNDCINKGTSIQRFSQRCIKYDIEPTHKALLMEMAIKNL
jgi:hypothetical protein